MSLKPDPIPPIPPMTAQVARAAFPKGNIYLQIRDALGTLFTDELFADLFPPQGQPASSPWRLALVTILQFMENLTIAKRQMRCAAAWIGSIFSAWT